jgi:hypothetical protein
MRLLQKHASTKSPVLTLPSTINLASLWRLLKGRARVCQIILEHRADRDASAGKAFPTLTEKEQTSCGGLRYMIHPYKQASSCHLKRTGISGW